MNHRRVDETNDTRLSSWKQRRVIYILLLNVGCTVLVITADQQHKAYALDTAINHRAWRRIIAFRFTLSY